MKVGDKIDVSSLRDTCSDLQEPVMLVNSMLLNIKVWSWGASAWKVIGPHCLRFAVNGHHHKGHVYLVVNGADLFDVYLTSRQGKIKKVLQDVFIGDLVYTIDVEVERVDEYVL